MANLGSGSRHLAKSKTKCCLAPDSHWKSSDLSIWLDTSVEIIRFEHLARDISRNPADNCIWLETFIIWIFSYAALRHLVGRGADVKRCWEDGAGGGFNPNHKQIKAFYTKWQIWALARDILPNLRENAVWLKTSFENQQIWVFGSTHPSKS